MNGMGSDRECKDKTAAALSSAKKGKTHKRPPIQLLLILTDERDKSVNDRRRLIVLFHNPGHASLRALSCIPLDDFRPRFRHIFELRFPVTNDLHHSLRELRISFARDRVEKSMLDLVYDSLVA